jgi:hypothetical protein
MSNELNMEILIIRSIQSDLLSALLKKIKIDYPKSKVSLFDNHKQDEFSKSQPNIDYIYRTKKKGDYGVTNISLHTIFQIRKKRFDIVIVPHKQYGLAGLDNVCLLLPLLSVRKWFHCSIDWELRSVGWVKIGKMTLNYFLALPIAFLLFPITVLGFLVFCISPRRKSKDSIPWSASAHDIHRYK